MKKIKVEVSKQDIEVGTRGEPDCCPIAWALERKDFKEIYVSDAYVNFEDEKGNLHEYYLPPKALGFVKAFDKGEDVFPFEFTLGDKDAPMVEHLIKVDY
jgi:hypothetical protein